MITTEDKAAERQALKKEIIKEIKSDERRRKLMLQGGCLLLLLVIIAIPVYLVASLLAKTGYANVPLLTAWQYHAVAPSRVVEPLSNTNTASIMKEVTARAKYDPQFSTVWLGFKESELTTVLREELVANKSSLPLPISTGQVAVNPDSLEVFFVSPRQQRNMTFLASFKPEIVDGALKLTVQNITLGSLKMPGFVNDAIGSAIGRIVSDRLTGGIKAVGSLRQVKLEQGVLRIGIMPKS